MLAHWLFRGGFRLGFPLSIFFFFLSFCEFLLFFFGQYPVFSPLQPLAGQRQRKKRLMEVNRHGGGEERRGEEREKLREDGRMGG